jgi:hypothetical protein
MRRSWIDAGARAGFLRMLTEQGSTKTLSKCRCKQSWHHHEKPFLAIAMERWARASAHELPYQASKIQQLTLHMKDPQ